MKLTRADLAAALLVALTSALPYASSVGFEATYDDHHHVVRNPLLRDPANARLLFSLDYLELEIPDQSRPMLLASLVLDRALFGDDIGAYHLQNILLHALVAAFAFLLARRLGLDRLAAALGATLFAVHPACTEAVASVSNREELLVAAFGLAALLSARRVLRGDYRWLAVTALAFTAALLAKELALALPLLLLVLALHPAWCGERAVPRRRWVALAGAAAPGLAVFLGLHFTLGFPGLSIGAGGDPLTLNVGALTLADARWAEVPAVLGFRAFRVLVGWPLSAEHEPSLFAGPGPLLVGSLATIALLLTTIGLARRRPTAFVAVAWFLCASLPTLFGPWLLNPVADRYLYLPAIGALTLLGALLASRSGAIGGLALALALSFGLARSTDHVQVWRNDVALFEDATQHAPGSARAWQNLGAAYLSTQRAADAIAPLERAVDLEPEWLAPRLNLASAYLGARQPSRALEALSHAARMEVSLGDAGLRERAFNRWIRLLIQLGREDEARETVEEIRLADPGFAPARAWSRSLSAAAPD